MNFIQKINPLYIDIVIICFQYICIIFKFLNIDNGNFSLSRINYESLVLN